MKIGTLDQVTDGELFILLEDKIGSMYIKHYTDNNGIIHASKMNGDDISFMWNFKVAY